MVLVYAGIVPRKRAKGARPKSQQEKAQAESLQKWATYLFQDLRDKEATVVLPTIAMSELLVPVPARMRGALIAKLAQRFHIHPFDQQAAAIAADIWAKHNNLPPDQQYENRNVLKADAMIVASARSFGATDFYTHDNRCRRLAAMVMNGHPLPTHRYNLFADQDTEEQAE